MIRPWEGRSGRDATRIGRVDNRRSEKRSTNSAQSSCVSVVCGGRSSNTADAVIERFDRLRRSDRQCIEVDPGEDLRLCTGGGVPVDAEQCIPQGDQRSLVLLGLDFVRPDRLLESLAVRDPVLE